MVHDVGGSSGGDSVARGEHAVQPWELRTDALMWTLTDATRPGGPLMTVDELRRGIESLAPDDYRNLGYYEKWLLSMLRIMDEHGFVDAHAVLHRADAIAESREHPHP